MSTICYLPKCDYIIADSRWQEHKSYTTDGYKRCIANFWQINQMTNVRDEPKKKINNNNNKSGN